MTAPNFLEESITFDGKDDYIELPEMECDFSRGFTLEAWVYFESFPLSVKIFASGSQETNSFYLSNINRTEGIMLLVRNDEQAKGHYVREKTVEQGKWNHITFTIDASENSQLYKDGNEIAQKPVYLPLNIKRTKNCIGRSNTHVGYFFHGLLGEIRLWNTARSEAEIAQNMNRRLTGNEPGLVGYWPLNERYGTIAYDKSPNNYHGTIHGQGERERVKKEPLELPATNLDLSAKKVELNRQFFIPVAQYQTISNEPPEYPGMNFALLRQEGIKHIEKLAGKVWTDYNTHDPGITILEALCYAITDLSYRLSFPIQDLLASPPPESGEDKQQFFTARQILTANPLTINDYRKLLIDIDGIQNAWLRKVKDSDPEIYYNANANTLNFDTTDLPEYIKLYSEPLQLNGLYQVLIAKEEGADKAKLEEEVKLRLHQHRNLCEDFEQIEILPKEEITVKAEIEIEEGFDLSDLMAKIYFGLDCLISPTINFFTLRELLEKGKSTAEIFAGPPLEHGFIDDEQLQLFERKEQEEEEETGDELHTSDMIHIILDLEGTKAVKSITLSSSKSSDEEEWALELDINSTPRMKDVEAAIEDITFFKGQIPCQLDEKEKAEVVNKVQALQIEHQRPYSKITPDEGSEEKDSELEENGSSSTAGAPAFLQESITFDGVDDYVELPEMELDFSGGFTLEFWVYIDPEGAVRSTIIALGNTDTDTLLLSNIYQIMISSNFSPHGEILEFAKWIHIAITVDTSGNTKLYKNSSEVSQRSIPLPANVRRLKNSIAKDNVSDSEFFYGSLGEMRIWNTARSQAEIADNMNRRLTGNEPGLFGYWPLNEDSGTIAYDKSPAGNNGTIHGKGERKPVKQEKAIELTKVEPKDLPIPAGQYRELSEYESIQNDFPINYGIGEFGLPQSASAERKAQAKQLQAYLMFFDQLLANNFAQLDHVKDLFSFHKQDNKTYFSQEISSLPEEVRNLLQEYPPESEEDKKIDLERRNRFLNYLIGQYCEKFTDYSLLLYKSILEEKLIEDKLAFLQDYPRISADRGKAFNRLDYSQIWDTDNVSGLKLRISRLLGIPETRQSLATNEIEGFHLVEHILLRPRAANVALESAEGLTFARPITQFTQSTAGEEQVTCATEVHGLREGDEVRIFDAGAYDNIYPVSNVQLGGFDIATAFAGSRTGKWAKVDQHADPFSFQISFVFPAWLPRFQEETFRQLIQETLINETPAHITIYLHWFDQGEMATFELAYEQWLEVITDESASDMEVQIKTNNLIRLLKIAYPELVLDQIPKGIGYMVIEGTPKNIFHVI